MRGMKTFKQMYDEEKAKPTPAQAFISEVARITHKSEQTVKMWLTGRQKPDGLTCEVIASHYNVKVETLFPEY